MKISQKILKIFSIAAFVVFLTINPVISSELAVKPVRFAFVPDAHLAFKKQSDWILYNESLVIFQDVINTINSYPNLDFLVFGGDTIQNDDKELADLDTFIDITVDIKIPYYIIFGDRESDLKSTCPRSEFTGWFRKNGFSDPEKTYWAVNIDDNTLLIGLDTTIPNEFRGEISKEQLEWLKEVLENNKNKQTIIVMHHPAIVNCTKPHTNRDFILSNSNQFLGLLSANPQVKLVLSGHHHINSVTKVNNTIFITSPSIVTYPNSFKILELYPDRVVVEDKQISFKQIVKKAKKDIIKTDYARQYDYQDPQSVLQLQEGNKFSRQKVYYL